MLALLPPIPARAALFERLNTLVGIHKCIEVCASITVPLTTGFSPLLGQLGVETRTAIGGIIKSYIERPPTHEVQRLLALQ